MKFFNWELRKVGSIRNNEAEEWVNPEQALLFGKFRSQFSSLNLSAVFRCVDLISDSIGMLPIEVARKTEKRREAIPEHPIQYVLKNSLSGVTKYEFMKLLLQSVLLKGNGFAYIQRATDGTVTGLRFLESGDVNIHYDKHRSGSLYYTCNLFPTKKIEPCNMIHLLKYSFDGINGKSVLSFADRTLKLSQSSENSALGLFESGCNLSGVLKVEGQLSKQQRTAIHDTWNQAMSNGGNGLAVLQGNMSYQPIQLSASDSQLLESRLFQVSEIARFFGINPVLLGDLSKASYTTLEAAQQEFLVHTLQPYILMIEEEFSRKLLKPSESDLEVNLDETYILKTDKAATASYYQTLLGAGVLTINEVRKELGYSEVPGGDANILAYTKIEDNVISNNKKDE